MRPSPTRPNDYGSGHGARLPLLRPQRGRLLGGVCRGVSIHLDVPVWAVRLAFLIFTVFFGAGAVAYVFLWVFVPVGDPSQQARMQAGTKPVAQTPLSYGNVGNFGNTRYAQPTPPATAADGEDAASGVSQENLLTALKRASKPSLIALAGLLLLGIGLIVVFTGMDPVLVCVVLLALAGIGVAWLRFNAHDGQLSSMLAGVGLLFASYVIYAVSSHFASPLNAIVSGLALLIGVGLAVVPWANTLVRDLGTERALKEREEERADMTAHLHDGVLQTLALIQLHSEEQQTVLSLARQQERELRNWLYQERSPTDRSVSSGLKDIAAHVEDEHGKAIEIVTVGDAQPSIRTDALLDATRQALVNAVTHGGEPISLYGEARDDMIEVFVRDHGNGFDVDHIPENRLGIRESIIGRIRRRGGTVEIVSRPGWGTEVRMHMPLDGSATHPDEETHEEEQA